MLAAASLFQKIKEYLEVEGTLTESSRLGIATLSISVSSPNPQKKIKIHAGIQTG